MVNVGARVLAAGLAIASVIDRLLEKFMHGAAQLKFSLGCKGHPSLCQLRGDNAVEHIDPAVNTLENIHRSADAHEITRKLFRQMFGHESRHFVALAMRFAYGQPSDSQAVKGELSQKRGTLLSEIGMAGSLNNAKQRLE